MRFTSLRLKLKMNNYRKGHFAEKLAAMYLLMKGYWPLAFNYSGGKGTHAGEIDLIVRRGKTIVFVEVKQRTDLVNAAYAIQPSQQERIRRNAEAFLSRCRNAKNYSIRFDAILISYPLSIKHLPNVF